jgi:hypothetical protein
MHRHLGRYVWATLLCAALAGSSHAIFAQQAHQLVDTGQTRSTQPRRPNVLIIMADDLNNDLGTSTAQS